MLTSIDSDRKWPVPARPWAMRMTWHDLLFMHYRINQQYLQALVPEPLTVETFDGSGWLGIVPFRMTGVAPRWSPTVPGISRFPELNVRTYVTHEGKPGVWFFSLEATNPIAVRLARHLFHLNYVDARIDFCQGDRSTPGNWLRYRSVRTHRGEPAAKLACEYRPIGDEFRAAPGSLESFLTARYCMYSADGAGQVYRGEIDHDPWQLQHAQAVVAENTMADWLGIDLPPERPLLHYARKVQTRAWTCRPI